MRAIFDADAGELRIYRKSSEIADRIAVSSLCVIGTDDRGVVCTTSYVARPPVVPDSPAMPGT